MREAEDTASLQLEDCNALGIPEGRFLCMEQGSDWIGQSICWVPDAFLKESDPFANRHFYSFVSSRMGRHPHRRTHWFRLLERAIEMADRDDATMISVSRTASAKWVSHACKLFRKRELPFEVSDWTDNVQRWRDRIQKNPPRDTISVSPPIDIVDNFNAFPRRDVFSIATAEKVFAPLVSARGNIASLLRARLADASFSVGSVWVAVVEENKTATELTQHGAIGWIIAQANSAADTSASTDSHSPILTLDELLRQRNESLDAAHWSYLTHCTRERSGRWPSQTEEAYRDEMLLSPGASGDGVLGSLERILQAKRIEASDRVTRGDTKVVCFSQRKLTDLLANRSYRSHLGRWDYEPFGISIRTQTLDKLRCRPVIYGDDSVFQGLAEADRPFFQSEGSTHAWSQEQEWRMVGNLDLSQISADDAFVFVPTPLEAEKLAPTCRWPIVVVGV